MNNPCSNTVQIASTFLLNEKCVILDSKEGESSVPDYQRGV